LTIQNKVIRLLFSIIGGFTGFTLTNMLFKVAHIDLGLIYDLIVFGIISLLAMVLFYSASNVIIEGAFSWMDRFENIIKNLSLYEITVMVIGLIAGLIFANLFALPFNKMGAVGPPIAITSNIIFGGLGVYIASGKRQENLLDGKHNKSLPNVLDTSVIIDGRIVDICRSGFLKGDIIIPEFVLKELRHIADSSDDLKRAKGRRGLDVLNILQKEIVYKVKIEHATIKEGQEVDSELIKLAKKIDANVLTTDYNLNKVAKVIGVKVLNINELANALKPIALPGEVLKVQVVKEGKENGQGIGYMEDGTMIVVENGSSHIDESLKVEVTSILQTSAGRMVFARPK
jgi:uncharacterized protein YacL